MSSVINGIGTVPLNATQTIINASAISVVILAANPLRKKFIIYNGANQPLYISYGSVAIQVNPSMVIAQNGAIYESDMDDYTGEISGIWRSGVVGSATITEITI